MLKLLVAVLVFVAVTVLVLRVGVEVGSGGGWAWSVSPLMGGPTIDMRVVVVVDPARAGGFSTEGPMVE